MNSRKYKIEVLVPVEIEIYGNTHKKDVDRVILEELFIGHSRIGSYRVQSGRGKIVKSTRI